MFSSKRVVFVLLVFPSLTHTYHLADPFLGTNSFGKPMSWDTMDTVRLETAGR